MKEQKFYIKGMHCASCELLIEQKLLEIKGVEFADASLASDTLTVRAGANVIDVARLNKMFGADGYEFSDKPFRKNGQRRQLFEAAFIAALVIAIFWSLSKFGLSSLTAIGSTSSLAAFFVFGLIAGASTCAALVGGLVLSLSKQWHDAYGGRNSILFSAKPHLLFNAGRLAAYATVGDLLGFLGQNFKISAAVSSFLIIVVSATMLVLAFQMLGIKWFDRFRLALPKSLSSPTNKKNRTGIWAPFAIGLSTILLPCGFTLAVEGMAVLSGDPFQGSLIMLFFALGTAISLLAIGIFSAKLIAGPKTSGIFLKVAGILIIFFVLFNLNLQFGLTNYLTAKEQVADQTSQNVAVGDKDVQLIKAVYSEGNDIQPSTFEVKVNQPVRFEVAALDDGTGCMSTIMVPGLWDDPQPLRKGQTIIMEFTPQKTGVFQITCAMGVPRGTITVVN